MFARNDQFVDWSFRCNITKRYYAFIFINNIAGDFTGSNFTKQTIHDVYILIRLTLLIFAGFNRVIVMQKVNLTAYQFTPLAELDALRARLRETAARQRLKGTVLLNPEG